MFEPWDHLPLDRIITRISSPTTIMQFQRSSLDGILIELARLVTHGVNDNIFCLSSLMESIEMSADVLRQDTEGEEELKVVYSSHFFLVFLPSVSLLHLFLLFSNNTCCKSQQPGPSEPTDTLLCSSHRAALPCKCSRKLRAVQAWCMAMS